MKKDKKLETTNIKCPNCNRVTLDVFSETNIYKCGSCFTTFENIEGKLTAILKNGKPLK